MGTRSLMHFWETTPEWNEETRERDWANLKATQYMSLYQQYDGYPEGVGVELAEFIESGIMVNGFGSSEVRQFNGFGCFVAQYIATVKRGVGNLYITPPVEEVGSTDSWQEFEYTVTWFETREGGEWIIDIYSNTEDRHIFNGSPKELLARYGEDSVNLAKSRATIG